MKSAQITPQVLSQIATTRVLIVGDVMLDRYWFGDVERISPEAPVPVVRVRKQEARLGGAANVARNAAKLGANVSLLSVVGDDEAGAEVARLCGVARIQTQLQQDASIETIVKLRIIGRQQQLLRCDFERSPSAQALQAKLADFEAAVRDADIVIVSDYAKGSLAHVSEMIAAAKRAGKRVLVDPKGTNWSRYAGAFCVTPNRAELRAEIGAWSSESDLESRVRAFLRATQIDAMLLTRSEEGMSYFGATSTHHFPAAAREVFDVTGAGDTVIAAFAVMLAAGVDTFSAVDIANQAAGIVVGKLGTAVVEPEELLREGKLRVAQPS